MAQHDILAELTRGFDCDRITGLRHRLRHECDRIAIQQYRPFARSRIESKQDIRLALVLGIDCQNLCGDEITGRSLDKTVKSLAKGTEPAGSGRKKCFPAVLLDIKEFAFIQKRFWNRRMIVLDLANHIDIELAHLISHLSGCCEIETRWINQVRDIR